MHLSPEGAARREFLRAVDCGDWEAAGSHPAAFWEARAGLVIGRRTARQGNRHAGLLRRVTVYSLTDRGRAALAYLETLS